MIDNYVLAQAGLVPDAYLSVRLIKQRGIKKALKGSGDRPHKVELQGISEGALKMLVGAGGSFKKVPRPQRPASEKKAGRKEKTAGEAAGEKRRRRAKGCKIRLGRS